MLIEMYSSKARVVLYGLETRDGTEVAWRSCGPRRVTGSLGLVTGAEGEVDYGEFDSAVLRTKWCGMSSVAMGWGREVVDMWV